MRHFKKTMTCVCVACLPPSLPSSPQFGGVDRPAAAASHRPPMIGGSISVGLSWNSPPPPPVSGSLAGLVPPTPDPGCFRTHASNALRMRMCLRVTLPSSPA